MYREEFKPDWSCEMLAGCPPEDVLVPNEHLFYRMASQATTYTAEDFKSYADTDPQHDRGEKLPLTLGLSLIDSESKAKLNNVKDMRPLTLIHTLVYYDVPQIFVAVDATGTNYLCTLYLSGAKSDYLYLGVQISQPRLMAFIGGQLDLRDAYVHPEVENTLYVVTAQ